MMYSIKVHAASSYGISYSPATYTVVQVHCQSLAVDWCGLLPNRLNDATGLVTYFMR